MSTEELIKAPVPPVFHGEFDCEADVLREFEITSLGDGLSILYANYDLGCYEGYAWVVLTNPSGDLFEVFAAHCSCMGLERQWDVEPTSYEAIAMRPGGRGGYPGIDFFNGRFQQETK